MINRKNTPLFKSASIQTKLMTFFVIIATALFFTVGLLFFRNTQSAINTSKEVQLITLSQETANKIERFLFERYGDIQVMAKSPLLKNQQVDKALKQQYLESVRNAYKTYDYIFIADKQGAIQILSGNIDGDNEYKKWLGKVLKGDTFISDFIYIDSQKSCKVYFAAPIVYDNGEIGGVVVERMNFNSITEIVNNVRPGKSGYAYLLEEGGQALFHIDGSDGALGGSLQKGMSGIFYGKQNGIKDISAYYPIKKYDSQTQKWYMVIEEPVKEAFEVTNRLRNYTILVVLIAVFISYILATMMSKLITRPIKKLVVDMQTIAEGDISQDIRIESSDEIGSLAHSFNMLLSDLKSMMQQVLEISGEAASMAEIRQYTDEVFDNIPCGITAVDSTGKITTFNSVAATITGLEPVDIMEKNIEDSLPENIAQIIALMKETLEGGAIYIKHIIHISGKSGEEIPLMINTTIQKDNSGKVLGVVGVFRKVDELRKFEESVVRANNLASLGALSAGMAHEIRNPLTSVKGYAQYIKSELGESHVLNPDIAIIISEVDRLNGIIDRFLTFARPRQPELIFSNINSVLENVLRLLGKDSIPENIEIRTRLEEVPEIPLDAEQMEQAVLNMVLNSIQAMPQGGILELATRYAERPGFVEILIGDTGIGICPEDYDKIFEPFFTTKNKGTGLGLAICSRIIENHKGFIEVSSNPEVGTKFIIKLPSAQ